MIILCLLSVLLCVFPQEAVLAIGSATSAISFRETVLNALHVSLFNVVSNYSNIAFILFSCKVMALAY